MKNILTNLTAFASRGAFRSAFATIVLTVAVLTTVSPAMAGTRKSGYYEYSGTITTTVLGYRGPSDIPRPAVLKIYDSGRVTLSNTDGLYQLGGIIIDTAFDNWSGWNAELTSPGVAWASSRTFRGSKSAYYKLLAYYYYGFPAQVLFANQVFTNKTTTDGIFTVAASSYSAATITPYDLRAGTKFTFVGYEMGKLGMICTDGGIGGSALTVSFMEK